MGPKRDIIGELAKAVRAEGLVFGVSSHRAEHWWFFDDGKTFDSDVRDPRYAGLLRACHRSQGVGVGDDAARRRRILDDWLARTAEIVDKYQPQLIWFDWWIAQPAFQQPTCSSSPPSTTTAAREWNKGVAINYKKHGGESFPDTAGVLDIERGQLAEHSPATSGRPTRRSRRTRGATSQIRTTRRWTRSSTT